MSATVSTTADPVICHGLQVRASQMSDCVSVYGMETVADVKAHCGAGGGCTACHRRIRDLIAAQRNAARSEAT
jgi:NAD(P)H-nitrite reductase large subunit